MNELTVFHLQAFPLSYNNLQTMTHGLSDTFRAFCNETFPSDDPIDWPPLRIVTVKNELELKNALFSAQEVEGMLTDEGKNCILFLLDDAYITPDDPTTMIPLHMLKIDGVPLTQWLYTCFPAIPKIVLSTPGATRARVP